MNSILTNPSLFRSLKTLNGIGTRLAVTQNRVSTGLKVDGAVTDASNFAIAQGIRADIKAVSAVQQGLNAASGTLKVAISAATAMSDLMQDLRAKAIERTNPGNTPEQAAIVDDDIAQLIDQMQGFVDNASFNGENLLKGELVGTLTNFWFRPQVMNDIDGDLILDQGESTMARPLGTTGDDAANVQFTDYRVYVDGTLSGASVNGPTTAIPANTTDQLISLFASATTSINPLTAERVTVGYTVDVDGYTATGSLEWGYGEPLNNGSAPRRAFDGVANGAEKFEFLADENGGEFRISRQPLGVDILGLDTLDFDDFPEASMSVIEDAERIISRRLGYLAAEARKVDSQIVFNQQRQDAISEGLGNMVDADMARESARLTSLQVQRELAVQVTRGISTEPKNLLALFTN